MQCYGTVLSCPNILYFRQISINILSIDPKFHTQIAIHVLYRYMKFFFEKIEKQDLRNGSASDGPNSRRFKRFVTVSHVVVLISAGPSAPNHKRITIEFQVEFEMWSATLPLFHIFKMKYVNRLLKMIITVFTFHSNFLIFAILSESKKKIAGQIIFQGSETGF